MIHRRTYLKPILALLCWIVVAGAYRNSLLAQCPEHTDISAACKRKLPQEMRELSDQLLACSGTLDTAAASLNHALSLEYFGVNADSGAFFTQRALTIRQRLYSEEPTEDLGKSYHNLGVFLNAAGKLKAAIVPLEQAITIFEQLDIDFRLHRSRLELSLVLGQLGDYVAAQTLLNAAVADAGTDTYALAQANHNLGLLWQQQGLYLRADTALSTAAGYYLDDPDPDYWNYVDCVQTLATVKDHLQDFPAAVDNYLLALRIASELDDPAVIALAANNLGLAYVENQRTKLGFQYLQRGLRVARAAVLTRMVAQAHDHFGEYYLAINRPEQAITAVQRAQETLIKGYKADVLTSVPTAEQLDYAQEILDLLRYFKDQARALEALFREDPEPAYLTAALSAYRRGDLIIDRLRADHDGVITKLIWREKAMSLYEAAISLCQRTNNDTDAYYFFEKSKGVLLYEAMLEGRALNVLPENLRSRERDLYFRAEDARKELGGHGEATEASYTKFISARNQLETFRDSLQEEFPAFGNVGTGSAVTDWQQLNAKVLMDANQWMVQYFLGEKEAYALLLNPAGPKVVSLGKTDTLTDAVNELLFYFSASGEIISDPAGYTATAHEVYQQLMEPLNLPSGQALLIVPDGVLTYLPFAALTTTTEFSGSFGTLETVLRQHQISYSYSGTVAVHQAARATAPAQGIGAFAPFGDGSSPTGYPRLDFASDELSELSERFDLEIHQNNAATRREFISRSADYNIVHLSTHAFSSPREQAPLIAFYDTLLFLQDVYRLPLAADLVVLSACQTNIGKNAPGEGTFGLGRGFTQAGARGIVSSLWNVSAASTGKVLTRFYAQLANNAEAGKALHQAQLAYCTDDAVPDLQKSPYHWAGLTYYGPEQRVTIPESSPVRLYLWLLAPLVGIVLLVGMRRYFGLS